MQQQKAAAGPCGGFASSGVLDTPAETDSTSPLTTIETLGLVLSLRAPHHYHRRASKATLFLSYMRSCRTPQYASREFQNSA